MAGGLKHKVVEVDKKEKAVGCIDGLYAEWSRCGQERGSGGEQKFNIPLGTR